MAFRGRASDRDREERDRGKTSLIYAFISNLMQAFPQSVYSLWPIPTSSLLCTLLFFPTYIQTFLIYLFTSALVSHEQPPMTSLTSTALWSNTLCWGNWEDGQWWFWYIVRAIRREGSPQGCLWARCAVSQNIMTCHKLQYKEGCRLLQPSCFI